MKRFLFAVLMLSLVSVSLFGCSTNDTGGSQNPGTGLPAVTAVMGRVLSANGTGVPGVTVKAAGAQATTAADGKFQLKTAAGSHVVVLFDKDGYVHTAKRVDVQDGTPTALQVTLIQEAAPVKLDAHAGGSVVGARGATINAPADAFVDSQGKPVSGEVQVHLTPLDPSVTAQLDAYPGDLAAKKKDGSTVQLQTYGVLDVTVRQNGEKLQIAGSKSVDVKIPAPAALSEAPPKTVGLWSFDDAKGVWVEEGTVAYNETDKAYEGKITHMSPWNADAIQDSTCIHGRVVDQYGNVIPGALIIARGIDFLGGSSATTGKDGTFNLIVRKSSTVKVTAIHPMGGAVERIVSTGASSTTMPPNSATCDDKGDWEVTQGKVVGSGGTVVDCSDLKSPYAGTCAEDMMSIFTCFNPQGTCTYDVSNGVVSYTNGASMTVGGTSGTFTGPDGVACGSYTVDMSDTTHPKSVYQNTSGEKWTVSVSSNSDQVIECPNGEKVTLTSKQATLLADCGGSQGTQDKCEVVGGGTGGMDGGGMPASCKTKADCSDGEVCCPDIGGPGVGFCFPDYPGVCG